VTEEGFNGVRLGGVVDLFVPLTMAMQLMPDAGDMREQRGAVWLEMFGRLAPGANPAMAQAELSTIADGLAKRYPESNKERGIRVSPGLGLDPFTRGKHHEVHDRAARRRGAGVAHCLRERREPAVGTRLGEGA
jgi:hypothetical protein